MPKSTKLQKNRAILGHLGSLYKCRKLTNSQHTHGRINYVNKTACVSNGNNFLSYLNSFFIIKSFFLLI